MSFWYNIFKYITSECAVTISGKTSYLTLVKTVVLNAIWSYQRRKSCSFNMMYSPEWHYIQRIKPDTESHSPCDLTCKWVWEQFEHSKALLLLRDGEMEDREVFMEKKKDLITMNNFQLSVTQLGCYSSIIQQCIIFCSW